MLQNTQPPEKAAFTNGEMLQVFDIWDTIQGEGPFAGCQATFIRLAGCNLQCPLCDTDYTSARNLKSWRDIVFDLHKRAPELVVLTGGEPFRQTLGPLCEGLLEIEKKVQIETNGTLYNDVDRRVCVVCSPKTGKLNSNVMERIDAWKYVLRHAAVNPDDGLPTSALGMLSSPQRPPESTPKDLIYLQPCDDQDETLNKLNLTATLDSCRRYGYRFCLQIHKIVGLP